MSLLPQLLFSTATLPRVTNTNPAKRTLQIREKGATVFYKNRL